LFAGLALIADIAPQTRQVITLAAWGLDLAGLLKVLPAGLFGQVQTATAAEAAAQGTTTAGSTPAGQLPGPAQSA
jgi:hypothetical protein